MNGIKTKMAAVIVCILLILSVKQVAAVEFEYNLITNHHFDSCEAAKKFDNKVSNCGKVIKNRMFGLKFETIRIFYGNNSIGEPMLGLTNKITGPIIAGAYIQDMSKFEEAGLEMPIAFPGGIVPIFGAELDLRHEKIKVFTIITGPVSTFGIGFNF